ncbi:MAG: carotenoid 1,2-hydratase [Verrucomicrobiota bacterium]
MKFPIPAFLFSTLIVSADWIQPPLKTDSGYPVPQANMVPELPRAHGAHPGYGIEWWYWVGHLQSRDGEHDFGFQATVFRLEGAAGAMRATIQPVFGDQQLYMVHSALSDLSAGTYTHAERIYREGWQAAVSTERLDFSVGGIRARMLEGSETIEMQMALPEEGQLELRMLPEKPLVAFGQRGLSRKGADPAAVSWYWTYPRLALEGTLVRGSETIEVVGTGWMDHEISSSQLGAELAGWDWTAIQLDDGTEVKAYRLRAQDGSADPWSAVYWIDSDGKTTSVYADSFSWQTDSEWESPVSGNRYPNSITIEVTHPSKGEILRYRLKPLLMEQEFTGNRGDNAYWEGACEVLDRTGRRIGKAYLELAGYGGGLANQLSK